MCTNHSVIYRLYVTTAMGFWFDAVTSIPFSWIDWSVLQVPVCSACRAEGYLVHTWHVYIVRK